MTTGLGCQYCGLGSVPLDHSIQDCIDRVTKGGPMKRVNQEKLVEEWKDVPEGTDVIVTKDLGEQVRTKTRSLPWLLGGSSRGPGHTAVIMVEGISGCYLLERIKKVSTIIEEAPGCSK